MIKLQLFISSPYYYDMGNIGAIYLALPSVICDGQARINVVNGMVGGLDSSQEPLGY